MYYYSDKNKKCTKSKSGTFRHHKKNFQNSGKFLLKTGQSLEKQDEWEL